MTTARWKSSGAYEDQFERNIEEPRENSFGTCPMCGARGQYKCKGKVKGSIRKTRYLFLGQKYKDNGFVMRYIQVEKEWTLGFIAGDNGNEMYNAYEKLSGVELARAYFEPGKKAQVDYNKHDPYVGRDFWDDCNLYGLSSIRINSGPILPETYDEMAGTMFQYSAMKEYTDSLMSVCNPVEYLECYMRTPQLEMLVKMHLIGVAEKLIKCQYGIIEDETATRPDEFLGIRKEKLKLLIKEKGDIGLLRVLQMEKRLAENWTDEQVQQLAETGLTYTQVVLAEKYMTYDVKKIAMDTYRYTLFKMAFEERGLTIEDRKNPNGVVRLIRKITSATGIIAPFIQSMFSQGMINFGASAIMRWYTNNTSVIEDKYGNKMFGKVEPKLRKNDGFMAFDVAMFCKDELDVQIIYI